MTKQTDAMDTYDRNLAELFLAFDEVKATDQLKSATLEAIFAQMDEEEGPAKTNAVDSAGSEPVEQAKPADAKTSSHTLRLIKAGEPISNDPVVPKKRDMRFVLRIAAVTVAVILGVAGVVSYVLPVSHVLVSVDDASFDLGVNVYGTTVSATSSSSSGTGTLAKAKVHNVSLDDAVKNLMDACKEEGASESIDVSVIDGRGKEDPARAEELRDKAMKEFGIEDVAEPKKQEPVVPVDTGEAEPAAPVEQGDQAPQNPEQQQEPAPEAASQPNPLVPSDEVPMQQEGVRLEGGGQVPMDQPTDQSVAGEGEPRQGREDIQVIGQSPSQSPPQGGGQGGAGPVIEL